MPEDFLKEFGVEIAKQGFVVMGLLYVVVVLWRDNLKLRKQAGEDQGTREKRDDARFQEVKALVERAAGALEKNAAGLVAFSASQENTNSLVDRQGAVIEARTAIFQNIMTAAAVNQQILQGNRDMIGSVKASIDQLSQRIDNIAQRNQGGSR